VASLFSDALAGMDGFAAQAQYIESLTFLVIGGTVFFQGGTARYIGRWLGVLEPEPNGLVIIGAGAPARRIAVTLRRWGVDVMLIDTNPQYVSHARREGLNAVTANAISPETLDELDLAGFGKLLAMTPNEKVNILACQLWSREFGKHQVFRVRLEEDRDEPPEKMGLSGEGHVVFPEGITLEWLQHHLGSTWDLHLRTVDSPAKRQLIEEEVKKGKVVPLGYLDGKKFTFYEEKQPPPAESQWLVLSERKQEESKNKRRKEKKKASLKGGRH
jgi:Trk K+ transport system NAD-binding subunit